MNQPVQSWLELSVDVDRGSADDVLAFVQRHCPGGAVIEDRSFVDDRPGEGWATNGTLGVPDQGGPVTIKGFLAPDDTTALEKLQIALLLLSQTSPISSPRTRVLAPEDWAEAWKSFFPPQHIGRHTVIVPTWEEYAPRPGERIILLDPGMAFGTGLHPTTRLCLVAIEEMVAPGCRVLDVGTGSGILAIAAALAGADGIDAIDTDPLAVAAANENAERNRVGHKINVSRATLSSALSPAVPHHRPVVAGADGYDVVLVNILAEIIAAMAPEIASALAPGGIWVASGVISEKEQVVRDACQQAGLSVDERMQELDWVALVGHH